MALFTTSRPKISVKSVARFPARVTTDTGLSVTATEGTYNFALDYPGVEIETSIADDSDWTILAYNDTIGEYRQLTLDTVSTRLHADTVATFEATSFDPSAHAVEILGYHTIGLGGLKVRRVNSEPSHGWKFRSTDRHKADETTDETDGGWWEGYSEQTGLVNVYQFGAYGDGTTDDTSAILTAFTVAPSGGTVEFPEGTFLFDGGVVRNAPVTVLGKGRKSVIKWTSATNVCFYLGGAVPNDTPYPDFAAGSRHEFSGDIAIGALSITGIDTTTGLSAGDDVLLCLGLDPTDPEQNDVITFNRIRSVDSSTSLTLETPIFKNVSGNFSASSEIAYAPQSHVIYKYDEDQWGYEVGNLSFEIDAGDSIEPPIFFYRARNVHAHDLSIWSTPVGEHRPILFIDCEAYSVDRIYVNYGTGPQAAGCRNGSFRNVTIRQLVGSALYLEHQVRGFTAENYLIESDVDHTTESIIYVGGNNQNIHLKGFSFNLAYLEIPMLVFSGTDLTNNGYSGTTNPDEVVTEDFYFYGDPLAVKFFPLYHHKGILGYNGYTYSKPKRLRVTISLVDNMTWQSFNLFKGIYTRLRVMVSDKTGLVSVYFGNSGNSWSFEAFNSPSVDHFPADGVFAPLTLDNITLLGEGFRIDSTPDMQIFVINTGTVTPGAKIIIDIEGYTLADDGVNGATEIVY